MVGTGCSGLQGYWGLSGGKRVSKTETLNMQQFLGKCWLWGRIPANGELLDDLPTIQG